MVLTCRHVLLLLHHIRSVWSIRDLGYTFETDLFSANTFINTCRWTNLKPNPKLQVMPYPPSLPPYPP